MTNDNEPKTKDDNEPQKPAETDEKETELKMPGFYLDTTPMIDEEVD